MAATFDPDLSSDLDLVRFLTGDRVISDPRLSDEIILGLIRITGNPYSAAAMAIDQIIAQGAGAVSKTVGNLSISYGGADPTSAYGDLAKRLREKGAQIIMSVGGTKSGFVRML